MRASDAADMRGLKSMSKKKKEKRNAQLHDRLTGQTLSDRTRASSWREMRSDGRLKRSFTGSD